MLMDMLVNKGGLHNATPKVPCPLLNLSSHLLIRHQ